MYVVLYKEFYTIAQKMKFFKILILVLFLIFRTLIINKIFSKFFF